MIDPKIFDAQRIFYGAKGIVFIGEKILVYRRDTKTDHYPLCIDLPGGIREGGESPFDTFQREVKEEFNINIEADDIVYAKSYVNFRYIEESYFFVTKALPFTKDDIVFGDEGLEFFLLSLDEYLRLPDSIEKHRKLVVRYIAETSGIQSV